MPSGGILVWLIVSVAVSEEGAEGGNPAPVGALGSRNGGNLQWRRIGHTLHTTSLQTVVELSSRLILTKSNGVAYMYMHWLTAITHSVVSHTS